MISIRCDRCRKKIDTDKEKVGTVTLTMRSSLFSDAEKMVVKDFKNKHFCLDCMHVFVGALNTAILAIPDEEVDDSCIDEVFSNGNRVAEDTDRVESKNTESTTSKIESTEEPKIEDSNTEESKSLEQKSEVFKVITSEDQLPSGISAGLRSRPVISSDVAAKVSDVKPDPVFVKPERPNMGRTRLMTDEKIHVMLKKHDRGTNQSSIARDVAVSVGTVGKYLDEGIKARKEVEEKFIAEHPDLNKFDFPKLYKLISINWEAKEIAREFSIKEDLANLLIQKFTTFKILDRDKV